MDDISGEYFSLNEMFVCRALSESDDKPLRSYRLKLFSDGVSLAFHLFFINYLFNS